MCPKCNQVGCEEDCVEYIIVKETYVCEVPKHKYNKLKQELGVSKLEHLDDNLISVNNRLKRMSEEIIIEAIEIDDGDY